MRKYELDFSAALENVKNSRLIDQVLQPYTDEILTALRLAGRLQSGEVSGGIIQSIMSSTNPMCPDAIEIYKAMASQMLKEVQSE